VKGSLLKASYLLSSLFGGAVMLGLSGLSGSNVRNFLLSLAKNEAALE
jgi:hypothetical protein